MALSDVLYKNINIDLKGQLYPPALVDFTCYPLTHRYELRALVQLIAANFVRRFFWGKKNLYLFIFSTFLDPFPSFIKKKTHFEHSLFIASEYPVKKNWHLGPRVQRKVCVFESEPVGSWLQKRKRMNNPQ